MPRALRSRDLRDLQGEPRILKALADGTRQRILRLLGEGEMRAGDIAAAFDTARPTIAKHLRVLLDAGLVRVRASGRERHYSIAPGPLRDTAARVKALDALLTGGAHRLDEHLRRRGQ